MGKPYNKGENMKKTLLLLGLAVLFSNSTVNAEGNIAVVDLQKIVSNSSQVKQLKQEHAKKIAELDKIIVNARGEISNEKDPAKVLLLEDKYISFLVCLILMIVLYHLFKLITNIRFYLF